MNPRILLPSFLVLFFSVSLCAAAAAEPARYFRITVADEQTGRGVPLVELETVNHVLFVTDSAGIAAIEEPGLMGHSVYFHVRSHGYSYPKDGFGYAGFRVKLEPGGSHTIKVKRVNLAERLYRVTGQGIYRDSVLLGDAPPIQRPLLNGNVTGQDSVVNAIYHGKLYWFWGDTLRESFPLGQYATSGAVSDLPGKGGLDPSVGVNLTYFTDADGFSKKMCPIPGPGPVWIGGALVLQHEGREVMLCHYSRVKDVGHVLEQGIAMWNDEKEIFEKRVELPLDEARHLGGNAVEVESDGERWFYFCTPYPLTRVRAKLEDVLDPAKYESWAKEGEKWCWKQGAKPLRPVRGLFEAVDKDATGGGMFDLKDVETGQGVRATGGSVAWNAYRKKWVMITMQTFGRSMMGETWYSESDEIIGPWKSARRVVTHDNYSFYNIRHHPYFDQDGGRLIYFEGTYTAWMAGGAKPTPRYDYNQVMYRLDLGDPRLAAPVPVK